MKRFITLSFTLLLIFGFINLKGQGELKTLKEIRSFKENLLTGSQFNVVNRTNLNNQLPQKNERAVYDYGNPPDLNWKQQFGGSGYDDVNAVVSDENGNIFVTGSFSGEMSFSGVTYTSTGNREAFVAEFDNAGNLIWLTQIPATEGNETYSKDICIDTDGNFFITGYYTGAVTIGETNLPDMNEKSLFFAKLNGQGELINAAYHSENVNEIGFSIDTDNDGNIYVVSAISGSVDSRHFSYLLKYDQSYDLIKQTFYEIGFNNLIVSDNNIYYSGVIQNGDDGHLDENVMLPNPTGYNDVFIAKSNLDWEFAWGYIPSHTGNGFNGDSDNDCLIQDNQSNFFMAGQFRTSIIFGNDTLTNGGGFITKFDSEGNFLWGKQFDSPSVRLSSDLTGNAYVTGNGSLLKYDNNSALTWEATLENQPNAIYTNSDNKIITAGNVDGLMYVSQLNNEAAEEWTNQFGGNSAYSYQIGMVTDNSGNIYTYNYTSNTIDFHGETVNKGVFLCKQNGQGGLIWIMQFPDIRVYYGYGNYIAIDPANENVYITGAFYDDLVIPGETTLTPAENGSVFILKYGTDGSFKWSKQEDFVGEELSLTPDFAGNVLLTGIFSENITVSGTELESAGLYDCFIAKYNEEGELNWAIRAGGEDMEYSGLASVDGSNNIYFTGEFTSVNVTVDDTEYPMQEGEGNILFAKLTSDGNILWIKSFAVSQDQDEWMDWYCWPTGIKTDFDGNSYIKGAFGKTAWFDDIHLENPLSKFNKFITKIDSSGNALWAKAITKNQTYPYDFDYNQFDIDFEGDVYFGMQAKDTLFFGDDFQYNPSSANDLIVARYSTSGNLNWVLTMQGDATSYSWITSVAVYDTANVFVGGFFDNYLSIGNEELTSTNRHGFVTSFGINHSGFSEVYDSEALAVYPNPSTDKITLAIKMPLKNAKVSIYSVSGKLVKSVILDGRNEINISHLQKGTYLIKIDYNQKILTGKFVKW